MAAFIRVVSGVVTAVASFYFTFWIGGALISPLDTTGLGAYLLAALVSVFATRFMWARTVDTDGLLGSIARPAIVTGAIAFCAGFFGPMVFTPGANQGPLLGLFITGPLGFLAGGIGGGMYWAARRRRGPSGSALHTRGGT